MDEPVFPGRQCKPDDASLASILRRAKRCWEDLTAHLAEAAPQAQAEWKHYGRRSGWVFVLRGKRSNLTYMIPHEKHFMASFAFGEKAAQAGLAACSSTAPSSADRDKARTSPDSLLVESKPKSCTL